MKYFFDGLTIYFVIGVIRMRMDCMQPQYNQPQYIRENNFLIKLLYISTWPILISGDIFWYYQEWKHRNKQMKKTILVISEEAEIRQTVKDRFDMNWHKVKTITIGPENIGESCCYLVKYLERTDLVLIMNSSIAQYEADEILQLIYENDPDMPIIYTPSRISNGTSSIEKFPTMDIRCMRKPFDLSELLPWIEETLCFPD